MQPEYNPSDNIGDIAQVPPHSIDAEQSVLGGLLLDNESYERISGTIHENDFYRLEHRHIFHYITHLIEKNAPADVITIRNALNENGKLEDAGGLPYLTQIVQNTPSAANIRRYAEIVRERSILRQLASCGTQIARMAYEQEGKSIQEILDSAEAMIFNIAENTQRAKQGFIDMPTVLTATQQRVSALFEKQTDITGLASGFIDLDKKTAGFQPGDLVIVAGRPSMGKTAFAMNIAENAGLNGKTVAVFSMEMGAEQLAMRMIGSVGRMDQGLLRTGRLQDTDWYKLTTALEKLSDTQIFIDETPALTALEVRARARRLARAHNNQIDLIIIDYLQLMGSNSKRNDNRASELGEISRSLKALARELNTPIIALSQLSRSVEQRADKRPMMSDLRESGAIEQDADLIIFMYREVYYNPDVPEKDLAEAIIGKHRNGPTGKIDLSFFGQYARFDNRAQRNDYMD